MKRPALPTALIVLAPIAAAAALALPDAAGWRVGFGLPLLLVIPGLACALALFPGRQDPVRIAVLSLGLSLALAVFATVELAAGGLFSRAAVATTSCAIGVGAALVARARARRMSTQRARQRPRSSWSVRVLTLAAWLGVTIAVGAAVALARTPLSVPDDRGYTTLSISGNPATGRATVEVRSEEARARRFELVSAVPGRPIARQVIDLRPGGSVAVVLPAPKEPFGIAWAKLYDTARPARPYRRVRVALPFRPLEPSDQGSRVLWGSQ